MLTICLVTAAPTFGDYDLSWSTIDGGGGTSSGGTYTLMGTIAQHDAAYLSSDDYELLGGFCPANLLAKSCGLSEKDRKSNPQEKSQKQV